MLYDHSGVRTGCARRVPAGYFFSLLPATTSTPLPTAGGGGGIRGPMPAAEAAAARAAAAAAARPGSASPGSGPGGIQRPHTSMGFRPASAAGMYGSPTAAGAGGVRSSSVLANKIGSGVNRSGTPAVRPGSAVPGGAAARRAPSPGPGVPGRPSSPGPGAIRRAPSPGPPGWHSSSPSPTKGGGSGNGNGQDAAAAGAHHGAMRGSGSLLAPMSRWRSYGVPFSHPIHRTRAAALYAAVAQGPAGPADNEAAAVLQVGEQELRLPAPFMPGPLVLRRWDDIPRLYAEHMEAARALLPVSEEGERHRILGAPGPRPGWEDWSRGCGCGLGASLYWCVCGSLTSSSSPPFPLRKHRGLHDLQAARAAVPPHGEGPSGLRA